VAPELGEREGGAKDLKAREDKDTLEDESYFKKSCKGS